MSEGIHEEVKSLDAVRSWIHKILQVSTTKLLGREKKEVLNHKYKLFFRGETDDSRHAVASLFRNDKAKSGNFLYQEEADYLKSIYEQAPLEFDNLDGLSKIAKVQHYGGKTRLLDFTEEVEIAAFFACEKKPEKAGIIYCCYADYYDFSNGTDSNIRDILSNYCHNPELIKNGLPNNELYYGLTNAEIRSLIEQDHFIFVSRNNNERLNRQKGLFLWMGDTELLNESDDSDITIQKLLGKGKADHLRSKSKDFSTDFKSRYNGVISTLTIPSYKKIDIIKELKEKYKINSSYIYADPEKEIKPASEAFLLKSDKEGQDNC